METLVIPDVGCRHISALKTRLMVEGWKRLCWHLTFLGSGAGSLKTRLMVEGWKLAYSFVVGGRMFSWAFENLTYG